MAASIDILVDSVLKDFNCETTKPEHFLSIQDAASQKFKAITKEIFDFGNKIQPIKGLSGGLAELYIDGFDEEQIWQQMELHNESAFDRLMKNVAKVLAVKDKNITFKLIQRDNEEQEVNGEEDKEEEDEDKDSVTSELSVDLPQDSADDDENLGSDFDDDDNEEDLKFDEYKVLDEEREERPAKQTKPQKIRKTEVDDQFFKLGEMEKFLEKEEAENPVVDEDDDDEDIDFFEYIPSDDEENEKAVKAKYKDFFRGQAPEKDTTQLESDEDNIEEEEDEEQIPDGELDDDLDEEDEDEDLDDIQPKGKRVKFDFDDDSDSDEYDDSDSGADKGMKSSYEQRQERLRAKIKEMEEEALAPKPWQLMGETKAELRPENALLEEDLVFDHTTRQAPVITEETTRTLEDIIKQRIKDQAFDDVERKVKPVYDPTEYKKKLVLDQEKSKFSLAEIYEQEYLKQQELQQQANEAKASSLADPIADKQSDNVEHAKIGKMMKDLFAKLDALCNFHYTPRTPAPEIKIVSNMPSIAMEEIAPVAVSDAKLLAPEEVQDHVRGELKGDGEKDKTDRLRERRKKKAAQRVRHKERERTAKAVDKANPGLGNKHAKIRTIQRLQKAEKEGTVSLIKDGGDRQKAIKSSTAFFKQLQEDVTTGVEAVKREKTKAKAKRTTGSQLKL